MKKTIAVLIHCFLTLQCVARSDNVDTLEPIIRSSPELNITKEDFFGYTLVFHQLDATGGVENTRLVSGIRHECMHPRKIV